MKASITIKDWPPGTVECLARAISTQALKKFYADPDNQKSYEKWLKEKDNREREKKGEKL